MNTLKKFIRYYGPYKAVFFMDLFCAVIISLVDLAYPQILRTAAKTLFVQDKNAILQVLPWIGIGLFFMYVIQSCLLYTSYLLKEAEGLLLFTSGSLFCVIGNFVL